MKRITAVVLIAGQVLLPLPSGVFAADSSKPAGPPPAPKVKVNRTLPKVEPLDLALRFSSAPSDDELFRARVFEEPLVPIGGAEDVEENKGLAQALLAHQRRGTPEDLTAIHAFLDARPASRWRPSLLLNLGAAYYWTGYFSKALDAWEQVWQATKSDETAFGRAIADRAIGEIAAMNARVGRADALEAIFAEVKGRDVRGPATEKLHGAREGLRMMRDRPGVAFKCGPYALDRIRAFTDSKAAYHPKILAAKSTDKGLSLSDVHALAGDLKMGYQMAKRMDGASVIVPAVAHWHIGHFGALIREVGGRYLIQDPTFGDDIWTTVEALDAEGSGYFLVPQGPLPKGWERVGDDEGRKVWGKGHITSKDPKATRPCDPKAKDSPCGGGGGGGMAVWDVHSLLASINIVDTPVGYTPPVGPAVYFTATYNQRESGQPSIFTYSNLGQKWTHNWLSFIVDSPSNPSANVTIGIAGGGSEGHGGFNPDTQTYAPHPESQSILRRVSGGSSPRYEMQQPDGSKLVYAQSDGSTGSSRKVFLSEVVDPQGNKVTLTYDSQLRLAALRDAIGQVTTLSYGLAGDDFKITRVTDPFGRFAEFRYNSAQPRQLVEIEDVIGIKSQFAYGNGDVVSTLTTPYGTTRFFVSENTGVENSVDIIDPLGQRERVQWDEHYHGTPEAPSTVPSGIDPATAELYSSVTYYWSKGAFARTNRDTDVDKAKITTWLTGSGANAKVGMSIKATEKKPLENRVFYSYDGQATPVLAGLTALPNRVARVLSFDPATSTKVEEIHSYLYNTVGKVTKYTDPAGRETVYEYEGDLDLTAVKQKNGAGQDLLWRATYNGQHLPLTITDASNQTTTLTYNAWGQLETITTPPRAGISENRVTTLTYDGDGYLQGITGPTPGATVSFTYDGYGRPRTITNTDNYTVTLEYDAFDRPTKVYYPNGTFEEVVWDKLDVKKYRNLLGQVTEMFYDALRRPTAVRDPLGRTTSLMWCGCGGLERVIDPNGNATSFERDLQGRVTKETRADGSYVATTFQDNTSRVATVADARVKRKYTYNPDGTLARADYLNPSSNQPDENTPPVSFAYDPAYRRVANRTDRTGLTAYGYQAVTGALGSGRLGSIDGPLANDTATYEYEELGRVRQRAINGVSTSVVYDTLGRVSNVTNPLGEFAYGYDANTARLLTVAGPNGLTRSFSYEGNAGDRQLKEITNRFGTNVLSRFAYTYNADNDIATWTQETGGDPSTTQRYAFDYDAGSQLTSALLSKVADGSLLKSFAYTYDKSFNRTAEQIDGVVTSATHNGGNQIVTSKSGGSMVFEGTTTEPSNVTVAGRVAQAKADGGFRGEAPVTSGTNTVPVAVTDPSGNARTYTFQVSVAGGNATLTYDQAGNLLSDGTRTYEWDLLNRLLAINQGTHRTEFEYDGLHRRTRIVEKDNGAVTRDKRYLWVGTQIVEERDSATNAILKRYFGQGVQQGAQNFFYTRDHLGSVREVVDATGAVRARYDYDPYGRRTKVSGNLDADVGFTGLHHHAASGLNLALYRAYDPNLGRFLSRDPIGLAGGINLYAYVENNPGNYVDPLGLSYETFQDGAAAALPSAAAIAAAVAVGLVASPAVLSGLALLAAGAILAGAISLAATALDGCSTIDEVDQQAGGLFVDALAGLAALVGGGAFRKPPTPLQGSGGPNSVYEIPGSELSSGKPYIGKTGRPVPRRMADKDHRAKTPTGDPPDAKVLAENLTAEEAAGVEALLAEQRGLKNLSNKIPPLNTSLPKNAPKVAAGRCVLKGR